MSAIAYFILQYLILKIHGENSILYKAIENDYKGKISLILYACAIPLSFVSQWVSISIYFGVALLWIVPDKRIENTFYREIRKKQKEEDENK